MISFDFEYYRPKSINDAVTTYNNLEYQGKKVIYYGGGTEIITMARMNELYFNAVIDIKEIPECNIYEIANNKLIIGSAVTLTRLSELNLFPLLTKAAKATADHTSRDKITIGGNICGIIPYHESLLPFLLCESNVILAGKEGERTIPVTKIFDGRFNLKKGDFMVQIITDQIYTDIPYEFIKRTKMEEIDYPLISIAMLKKDNLIRAAFSGVCSYPFRSKILENDLNDKTITADERINNVLAHLPAAVVSNLQSSAEYREFVLRNTLLDMLAILGV